MSNNNYLPWSAEWRNALAAELDGYGNQAAHGGQYWLAAIAASAFLLALVLFVSGGHQAGFLLLNPWGAYLPPALWQHITFGGDGLFAVVTLLLFARRYPQLIWAGAIAAVLGTIFTHGIKHGLSLPRPPAVLEADTLHLVGRGYRNSSFPSGHAITAMTIACLWIYFLRSNLARATVLAVGLIVAFSRVFVGVHWPLDVLVSTGAAAVVVWLGAVMATQWRWGLRPGGHLTLVVLLTISAIALFGHDGDYPAALWLANTVAALALAIAAWDYVIQPWRQRRANYAQPGAGSAPVDR